MSPRVLDLLRSMDLFADLPDEELAKIARLLKEHKITENEVIFAQDDTGDGLYIILQGRVRIASTDHFGRERVLAFYGPGEFFGDMAVLTGGLRSATASASTEAFVRAVMPGYEAQAMNDRRSISCPLVVNTLPVRMPSTIACGRSLSVPLRTIE